MSSSREELTHYAAPSGLCISSGGAVLLLRSCSRTDGMSMGSTRPASMGAGGSRLQQLLHRPVRLLCALNRNIKSLRALSVLSPT